MKKIILLAVGALIMAQGIAMARGGGGDFNRGGGEMNSEHMDESHANYNTDDHSNNYEQHNNTNNYNHNTPNNDEHYNNAGVGSNNYHGANYNHEDYNQYRTQQDLKNLPYGGGNSGEGYVTPNIYVPVIETPGMTPVPGQNSNQNY